MYWSVLILSGIFEAVWALALSASNGFRNWRAVGVFVVALTISMSGLAFAMTEISTGTAYSVWVGVGATLTALWGIYQGEEPATLARISLLVLLVGSVIGLKVVS
ncbi:MAG: SMR family transporter [Acidimicrobiia bacterium]